MCFKVRPVLRVSFQMISREQALAILKLMSVSWRELSRRSARPIKAGLEVVIHKDAGLNSVGTWMSALGPGLTI